MGSFKLDSLAQVAAREEEGEWLDIKHPNGEPLCMGGQGQPLRIKVAGSHSNLSRKMVKKLRDQAFKRGGTLDGDDLDARGLTLLAGSTLGWEACFDDDGATIPLTVPNARMLYEAAPFIAEQVGRGSEDHARFFPPSSQPL